jgi:hypothetical protein
MSAKIRFKAYQNFKARPLTLMEAAGIAPANYMKLLNHLKKVYKTNRMNQIENRVRNNAAKLIQNKFRNKRRTKAAKTIQRTVKARLYKPITGAMYKKLLASTRVGR